MTTERILIGDVNQVILIVTQFMLTNWDKERCKNKNLIKLSDPYRTRGDYMQHPMKIHKKLLIVLQ